MLSKVIRSTAYFHDDMCHKVCCSRNPDITRKLIMQTASRMALSRVHASVKATDVAKLLLLNEHHQNLMFFSWPMCHLSNELCKKNQLSSFCTILSTNKQTNANENITSLTEVCQTVISYHMQNTNTSIV